MPGILVANVTTMFRHEGRKLMLRRGVTLVHADDPVVKGRESMFRPLEVSYLGGAPVETATAAPGEKRATPTPTPDPEPEAESNQPSQSDPKAAWVKWAVDSGRATENEAEAMTKAQLIDLR